MKRFKNGKSGNTVLKGKTAKSGKSAQSAKSDILTLANGFKVVFYQIPTIDMVSVLLRVNTGSNFEGKYIGSGISHFIEHGMFLGSKNQPGKDSFSNHIAHFGGNDLNAFTSENYTCFQFSVFTRYLEKSLALFFDFIHHPRFPKQAVNEEQGTIVSEMDLYNDKSTDWFYRVIFSRIFTSNPNELPIIGLRKNFHQLSHVELRDYHHTHYQPQNMHLVLVGKFNPDRVKRFLSKHLGLRVKEQGETPFIPGGKNLHWINSRWGKNNLRSALVKLSKPTKPKESISFKNPPFQITETSHPRVQFIKVGMGFEGLDFHEPANITLDVFSHILASGRGSILHELLKEKLGWVERISSYLLQFHPRENSKFFIEFTLPEQVNTLPIAEQRNHILKVYNRIITVLDRLENYLTPILLTGSKNTFLKSFVDGKDDFIDIANSLSYSLANYGHLHYEEEYFDFVKKVNRSAILKTAKEYLVKRSPHLFILLTSKAMQATPLFKKSHLNPPVPSEQVRFEEIKIFEDTLEKNLPHYQSEPISAIAPLIPPVPKLMCTQDIPDTLTTTLTNGTRFLSKKIMGLPKVCLQLVFKGGSILEQVAPTATSEKKPVPGSFNLLSKLFFSSNVKYTKVALAEGLRKYGITFSSFCGENSFGLGFSMLSSEVSALYPFLNTILACPRYSVKDFKKEQQEIIYTIKKSEEDSFYLALKKFKQYFFNHSAFSNDPYGELRSIPLLKPAHITSINHQYLCGNNLVAHLTGEYTTNQLNQIKHILTGIPAGTPNPDHFKKIVAWGKDLPPLRYEHNLVYEHDRGEQSHFIMGYRAPCIGEKDFGVFKLISHYLEGVGGPLFKLRSEDFVKNGKSLGGRCYRLGCFLRNSVGYGMLVFYASFRKEAAYEHEWAVTAFQKELHRLRTKLISSEDLERSKNTLLSEMMQESLKHAEISFNEALLETYGLGHDYGKKEITALRWVSAEEIRTVANTYLQKDNFFAYGMKPQP